MRQLLIGPMTVHNVNLSAHDYVTNIISPGALLGFASAIKHKLRIGDIYNVSVLPVIHYSDESSGRNLHELSLDTKTKIKSQEIRENSTGTVEISLIIDLHTKEFLDIEDIKNTIFQLKFAGGTISQHNIHGQPYEINITPMKYLKGELFRTIPSGWILTQPQRQQLIPVYFNNPESLKAMLDILSYSVPVEKSGFLVPCPVGYQLLEEVDFQRQRSGARHQFIPHVFVEPGCSLAEYISSRNPIVLNMESDEIKTLFWSWCEAKNGKYKLFSSKYENFI